VAKLLFLIAKKNFKEVVEILKKSAVLMIVFLVGVQTFYRK
jgi:hypothetical protein